MGMDMKNCASFLKGLSRYFHTVRYLRWQQIVGRLWYILYRPHVSATALPRKSDLRGNLEGIRRRGPSMTGPDSFIFLNHSGRIVSASDWNDPRQDKLWLYNLHYFDDLNAHDAESRFEWHQALIRRWIAENPPTSGNGWEPYPVSLRVVNWIKWDLRVGGLDEEAIDSLAVQLRWLRRRLEYHILGNHLLANAKALIFGGLYFRGDEAEEWFGTGFRVFEQQLQEQVLPDGGHFELSPMYHLIVLEDLLDVINIMQAFDRRVPDSWLDMVARMLSWADVMCHPDGEIPFFNDAAFGIAGTVKELRNYAERLGVSTSPIRSDSVFLRDSGYVRLVTDDAVLFFDVAPIGPDYLPGHAHADTLSLELSLFGRRVLVNSGTSVYGSGAERLRQRGTGAHNTIMVAGMNSSEVWSGFRVAHRARARILDVNEASRRVVAEHDGYRRLRERVIHRREVRLQSNRLVVVDVIIPQREQKTLGPRDVQGAWHLHPDIAVQQIGNTGETSVFSLYIPAGNTVHEARLMIQGAERSHLEQVTWHPEFGKSVPNMRVVFRSGRPLPATFTTIVQWSA